MSALKQDQRDIGLCGAKSFGDLALRHRTLKSPDLGHLVCGQKFFEAGNKPGINSVLFVEPVVYPFEIGGTAIRLDSINVVYEREVVWIRNEGNCDETMNVKCFSASVAPQADLRVSETVNAVSEDFAVASLWAIQSHTHPINASHTTDTTNLVEITEIGDWYGSPFFWENGIHVTGCPSGNSGSTIKDLSHVSTFGGSDIMASASDPYNRRPPCRLH